MVKRGLLKRGSRAAIFKLDGTMPSDNDRLTILVMMGSNAPRQYFNTTEGSGSRLHDLEAVEVTNLCHLGLSDQRKLVKLKS